MRLPSPQINGVPPLPSGFFRRSRRGWLLLEVIIALGLFSTAVVSFVVALNQTAEVSLHSQRQSHVFRLIEGALMEAATIPEIQEKSYTLYPPDDPSMTIDVSISPIELVSQDDTRLEDMWVIHVEASWIQDGVKQQEVLDTWRYGKMYQP